MPTDIPIPAGPSSALNLPRAKAPDVGEAIERSGQLISAVGAAKKDLEDTIEGNRLISEHAIQANKIQSDLLTTSVDDGSGNPRALREDELVPIYTKQLDELNQKIMGQARSPQVRAFLEEHLPARNAAKTIEMQAQSNARFTSNFTSELDRSAVTDLTARQLATTEAGKKDAENRHLNLIAAAESRGAITADQATKRRIDFLTKAQMFDVAQRIQISPEFGRQALLHPEKLAEQFPYVPIDQYDNIFATSVRYQEQERIRLEKMIKDNQDKIAPTFYEAAIKGGLTWDNLNKGLHNQFISKEDYVQLGKMVQGQYEKGGIDDQSVRAGLEVDIRANPGSYNPAIIGRIPGLSTNTRADLIDKWKTWKNDAQEDADRTDPRLKGPLWDNAKHQIDMAVGKGAVISGQKMDANTERRWMAARDELIDRATRDRNAPLSQIADDIVKKYQGPATPAEIAPKKYQDDKLPDGIDIKKLRRDYNNETDPRKKRELLDVMRKVKEFTDQSLEGQY